MRYWGPGGRSWGASTPPHPSPLPQRERESARLQALPLNPCVIPVGAGMLAEADPEAQVGFACAPNRMGMRLLDDPGEKALREAVCG